jgi:hypothetical protein
MQQMLVNPRGRNGRRFPGGRCEEVLLSFAWSTGETPVDKALVPLCNAAVEACHNQTSLYTSTINAVDHAKN